MNLSNQAKKDLLLVLQKDMGLEASKDLTDEDLNKIGLLLLTILAEYLKMKQSASQV